MNIVNKACFVVGLLSVIFNIYSNEKDYDKSNLKIKKNRLKTHNDTSSSYIQKPPFIWADLLLGIVAPGTTKGFKINIDFYRGIIGAFELVESEDISIICQSSQKWSNQDR